MANEINPADVARLEALKKCLAGDMALQKGLSDLIVEQERSNRRILGKLSPMRTEVSMRNKLSTRRTLLSFIDTQEDFVDEAVEVTCKRLEGWPQCPKPAGERKSNSFFCFDFLQAQEIRGELDSMRSFFISSCEDAFDVVRSC
jgi:hypothetical protein